jgi:hypothetical protein
MTIPKNLKDEDSKASIDEILKFKELVKDHRKLIDAIGRL